MTTELDDVRREVAIATRVLADVGLATGVTAGLGHASMRLPGNPDRFVVKGRQYAIDSLSTMRPEHMVVCDTDGFLVDGPPERCSAWRSRFIPASTRPGLTSNQWCTFIPGSPF